MFALVAFVHFPASFERRIDPAKTINVDLLAFNPETPLPPARVEKSAITPITAADRVTEKIAEPRPVPQPDPVPVKKGIQKKANLSNAVVAKPQKPKTVKKPAAKEIDAQEVLQDAVKRIEQQTAAAQAPSVSDRIASLKKEVLTQTGKPTGSDSPARSGTRTQRIFLRLRCSRPKCRCGLKNNWVFSEKLAGETRGLESRLVIKVLPDGTITDVWFERSGNDYLDNSAYKTVMKSIRCHRCRPDLLSSGAGLPSGLHQ
ncbi:MAG: hypothetical protein R2874_04560 [Desulfobacterales bacterium]